MKKLSILLLMICFFAEAFSQSGRIKVFFVGFECICETFYDILQPGDEGNSGVSYMPLPVNSTNDSAVPLPVTAKITEQRQPAIQIRPAAAIPVKAVAMDVTGTWAGNFGKGTNYNGAYCSFRLNADGTMQVIGADKTVVASGTFKFEKNQLSGTYIKPSGEIFSFNGKMDNNALTGTFGTGTNVSNLGTWRMTKQAAVAANLR